MKCFIITVLLAHVVGVHPSCDKFLPVVDKDVVAGFSAGILEDMLSATSGNGLKNICKAYIVEALIEFPEVDGVLIVFPAVKNLLCDYLSDRVNEGLNGVLDSQIDNVYNKANGEAKNRFKRWRICCEAIKKCYRHQQADPQNNKRGPKSY